MDLTWWQIVLGALVGLIILIILVIVHELGHAWTARRNDVEVEEFGVGFPPRAKILGKYKGTLITLNWLPLGGFCKLKGESDDAKGKGTYGAASFWAKTKILFAGVFMNLVVAMLIFTVLAWTGLPKISANQFVIENDNHGQNGVVAIAGVVENSPAEKAGLKTGDKITSINNEKIEISAQVSEITKERAGETIAINLMRDGQSQNAVATLNSKDDSGKGYLGIQTMQDTYANIRTTWSAPLVGIANTFQFVWMTLTGLVDLVANLTQGLAGLIVQNPNATSEISAAGDSVAGPVGILGVIFPSAVMAGPTQLFFLMGVISLTLTVMNILPIPGLDGGRWFLTAIYRMRGKKLTKEKEETIVGWGMMFLFGLIIVVTVADIWKLF